MGIVPDAGPERTIQHLQWRTMRVIDKNSGAWYGSSAPGARSRVLCLVGMVAGVLCSQFASAHHSFAQRVAGELQSIEIHDGTIELYKLLNPHSALIVRVDGEDAANDGSGNDDWLIELSSASTLSREGWTDEFLNAGDRVSIAILASRTPNRGRLRAMLVHAESESEVSRLIVAYGIRGDTPIMRRLRERLPTCAGINPRLERGECFTVAAEALRALKDDFPGRMGYILP